MEWLGAWFEDAGKIVAALTAICGVLLVSGRRLAAAYRSVRMLIDLHRRLGGATAEQIHDAIQHLRKSHNSLDVRQQLLERHCNVGIFVCDHSGKTVWANDVLCELYGLEETAMLGFGWLAAVVESERISVQQRKVQCINEGIPWSTEYTVRSHRTHEVFKVESRCEAIEVDGVIVCYVGCVKRLG